MKSIPIFLVCPVVLALLRPLLMCWGAVVVTLSTFPNLAVAEIEYFDLNEIERSEQIGHRLYYLEDAEQEYVIDQMPTMVQQGGFTRSTLENLSFGYSDSVFWIYLPLTNLGERGIDRLFEIAYPVLDHVDVYIVQNGKFVQEYLMGDKQHFNKRPYRHRNFVFMLEVEPQQKFDVYIRVQTSSSMQIPIFAWEEKAFIEDGQRQILGLGLYYGTMLVMVLYNMFVFLSVREVNYFYYVMYVLSMVGFIASLNGISYQYLWPNSIWWNDQSIVVSLAAVVMFGTLFTRNFLDLPSTMRVTNFCFSVLAVLGVILIAASMVLPYRIMIISVILVAVVGIFLSITTGIIRWSQGFSAAKFYTIAWSSMLFGGVILALNKFGVLPRNTITENGTQIGSALEVILLSFALADRLNLEKKMRYEAQMSSLEHERESRRAQEKALLHERDAREAQERALRIQQRANEMLERRVQERTDELEKANVKLQELSTTDGLTGLKNRRHFDEVFRLECKRAVKELKPLSVIILDIDHFKRFNDQYGHLIGDDCLITVANAIRGQIHRDNDVVARYGGEEFVLVLPGTESTGAMHVADTIRLAVMAIKFRVDGVDVPVTISLGVATGHPDNEDEAAQLLEFADTALYISKKSGRNCATLYSDSGKADMPKNI